VLSVGLISGRWRSGLSANRVERGAALIGA